MHGVTRWRSRAVRRRDDVVVERQPHRRHQRAPWSAPPSHRRIARRLRYSQCASMTGSGSPPLPSRDRSSRAPQPVGAAHLEPDQVVGVVDDAHLVGLGVAHADVVTLRRGRSRPQSPSATASGVIRGGARAALAWPRSASARAEHRLAGDEHRRRPPPRPRRRCRMSMPPSTSIGARLPARRAARGRADLVESLRGMNVWPPKPGLTDITRT